MALVATDIGATRYLSRAYFERAEAERMAKGLVHYVMWIVTHPDYQGGRAMFTLTHGALAQESEEGALLVFDLPESNQPNQEGGLADLLFRLAKTVGPVNLEEHGGSRYYALDFAPVEEVATQASPDTERVST
jgi:hypothetical protein